MAQKLKNVVTWKARVNPARRIIPPHLKLAILSRAKLLISADLVEWFLDELKAQGVTWPNRLTKSLAEIASDYSVTFELFQNQRLGMTDGEIEVALNGYMSQRKALQLADQCWFLSFLFARVTGRSLVESKLDVDLRELFRKPKVRPSSHDHPDRYIIVQYVCFPKAVSDAVRPENQPPPAPPLSTKMPPLDGLTKSNTQVHLRDNPTKSATSLGVEAGEAARVKVTDKTEADGELWYKLELLTQLRVTPKVGDPITAATYLPVGTTGWMAALGIDILVAPWELLRNDLIMFDQDFKSLTLNKRITAFRQRFHESQLPFDEIIGTNKGTTYLEDIGFDAAHWQHGRDYQAFVAPDGRWVDLQHLAVGLDVLHRREQSASILNINVGTNYSASTWAGDVGSAAAEATMHRDKDSWERWNPKATEAELISHYFETRCSEHDRLGNLDGWGMQELRKTISGIDSLDALIALYYEDIETGTVRSLIKQRRVAVERFMKNAGFTYDASTDISNYPVLQNQNRPVDIMAGLVEAFGIIWMFRREPNRLLSRNDSDKKPEARHTTGALQMFLYWLEYTAAEHEAVVS